MPVGPVSPEPAVAAKRHRRRRRLIVAGAVTLVVLVTPFVVNALTPRPLALLLRSYVGATDDTVTIGPYADRLKGVNASAPVSVPVDGLPDAELTLYSNGDGSETGKPVVLFIHGGGWILGKASQVASYAKLLASEGYLVANLDYSLAPEYEYPAPVLQSLAALDYLHKNATSRGGDPARLFVGGNSAGAQIAAQLGAIVTNPSLQEDMHVRVETPTYLTTGDADSLEPQSYELDAVLRAKGSISRAATGREPEASFRTTTSSISRKPPRRRPSTTRSRSSSSTLRREHEHEYGDSVFASCMSAISLTRRRADATATRTSTSPLSSVTISTSRSAPPRRLAPDPPSSHRFS